MSQVWTFFLVCVVASTTVLSEDIDDSPSIGEEIENELAALKEPIEEPFVDILSAACKGVKELIGLSYEELEDEDREPDLNELTLVFKTPTETITINLTSAVEELYQARTDDPDEPYIIYVHGFTDSPSGPSFGNISEAYFEKGYSSVIALNSHPLTKWLYLRSSTYVRFIGQRLGEVLANLVASGVNPDNIHIIGHSLGAHIAGFAGKTFTNLTGEYLGRLSALDPAGPCFSYVSPEMRVNHNDAAFVMAIHTDGGFYGMTNAVGDVDFYPNSGVRQPNCFSQSCSHSRAWLYYSESVNSEEAFPAVRCQSWKEFKKGECEDTISYMGYPTKSDVRGKYYLQTRGDEPYGLGLNGTKYTDHNGLIGEISSLITED